MLFIADMVDTGFPDTLLAESDLGEIDLLPLNEEQNFSQTLASTLNYLIDSCWALKWYFMDWNPKSSLVKNHVSSDSVQLA